MAVKEESYLPRSRGCPSSLDPDLGHNQRPSETLNGTTVQQLRRSKKQFNTKMIVILHGSAFSTSNSAGSFRRQNFRSTTFRNCSTPEQQKLRHKVPITSRIPQILVREVRLLFLRDEPTRTSRIADCLCVIDDHKNTFRLEGKVYLAPLYAVLYT